MASQVYKYTFFFYKRIYEPQTCHYAFRRFFLAINDFIMDLGYSIFIFHHKWTDFILLG